MSPRWVPPSDRVHLDNLRTYVEVRDKMDADIQASVVRMRTPTWQPNGVGPISWQLIADALGMTKTTAYRTYGPACPPERDRRYRSTYREIPGDGPE